MQVGGWGKKKKKTVNIDESCEKHDLILSAVSSQKQKKMGKGRENIPSHYATHLYLYLLVSSGGFSSTNLSYLQLCIILRVFQR